MTDGNAKPVFTIDAGLARLFTLGLDADIEEKVTEWKASLDRREVTDEMRHVFFGIGYLSSLRDPRIKPAEPLPTPGPQPETPFEPVELVEPRRRSQGVTARG